MFRLELDEEAKRRVSDYIHETFLASGLLDKAVRNLLGMALGLSEPDIRLLAGNVRLEVEVREGEPTLHAVPLNPASLPDRSSVSYRISPAETSSCLGTTPMAMIALMGVWSEPNNANYVPTEGVDLPELVVLSDGNIVHCSDLPELFRQLAVLWHGIIPYIGGEEAISINVAVAAERWDERNAAEYRRRLLQRSAEDNGLAGAATET